MTTDEKLPSREEVLAVYGEAMLAVQRFELAMIGLLGVRHELSVLTHPTWTLGEPDDFEQYWESLFTRTAGRLRKDLKLAETLGQDVEVAVHARNLLAHHYLRDHASHLARASSRAAMAACLTDATARFQETLRPTSITTASLPCRRPGLLRIM